MMPRPHRTASVGRCVSAALTVIIGSACATTSPLVHQECNNPDAQLGRLLQPLETLRANGCEAAAGLRGASDCEQLRREIERLALVCPGHVPTLMANAVIAYDEHRPANSQQLLDQILAQSGSHPDAAALRARIAIEEGNVPFARRLLEQQIKLVPDHPGLHETFAASLYLDGQLPGARSELTLAGVLGAPRWRIAYHLGLIEEALGRGVVAIDLYNEALQGNPGWARAESRRNALRARAGLPR
jgi:tetratricopeptide (TPR) repeat protein